MSPAVPAGASHCSALRDLSRRKHMSQTLPPAQSDDDDEGRERHARLARGHCLCGAVRFAIRLPSKWVVHCHCRRCQRAHGAAFVTWVGVDESAAQVDDAQQALAWHVAAEGGHRGFCARCGSPMFFRSARYPGELHLARALFDDPLDRAPESHAFYDSHVDWVTIAEPLPAEPDPP